MSLIYDKIDKLRKLQGLQKMEFYDLIGTSANAYKYMVNHDTATLTELKKIASVLKTTILELIDEGSDDEITIEVQSSPSEEELVTLEIINSGMSDTDKIKMLGQRNILLTEKNNYLSSELEAAKQLAEMRKKKIVELEESLIKSIR
jgi:hypothetical protein